MSRKKTTSKNSSLAPSQDPHRKKKSKQPSGKKPGGQKGHPGSSLEMTSTPDEIILHPAIECNKCGSNLKSIAVDEITRHQVIDIKFAKIITEHQVEHKMCDCGHHQAHESSGAPIQYGPGLKATSVELNQIQCVPFKRCAEFLKQKFSLTLSPATLVSFARQASMRLVLWEESIKHELLESHLLHADETGINVNGKNWWVHVLSTEHSTLMIPHIKRGSEAMIEAKILPHYHGILSHDFWSSYNNFDVIHAPCHSHLQREFEKVYEQYGQKWAKDLGELMLCANKEREDTDGGLSFSRIEYFEKRYSELIELGKKDNPLKEERTSKRGRIGQDYPRQLLNRLIERREWVLLFLYDLSVPFTNNQAEREIRMLKVQQKVSGYFKTEQGARDYCRIRSYILTMEKRGYSKHEALTLLLQET